MGILLSFGNCIHRINRRSLHVPKKSIKTEVSSKICLPDNTRSGDCSPGSGNMSRLKPIIPDNRRRITHKQECINKMNALECNQWTKGSGFKYQEVI
jgi:hypothetical protein